MQNPNTSLMRTQSATRVLDEFTAEISQGHANVRMDHLTTILIQEAMRRQAAFTSAAAEQLATDAMRHYGAAYRFAGALLAEMDEA